MKIKFSLVFITQSNFKVPKDVKLNPTYFFVAKKKNNSSNIKTEDFINIYRECTAEPYSFFINGTTLASNNPLSFRKKFFNIHNKNRDN